jgi:hypothetical protein
MQCRWCGRSFVGVVPICSSRCFGMALWVGWFDAKHLWARRNGKLVIQARADSQSGESEARKEIMTMADRDFPNSGILFRNDRKREGGRDPDYQGTADISCGCGQRFTRKLAGWIKQGKNGKFLALSLKPYAAGVGEGAQTREAGDENADASF